MYKLSRPKNMPTIFENIHNKRDLHYFIHKWELFYDWPHFFQDLIL